MGQRESVAFVDYHRAVVGELLPIEVWRIVSFLTQVSPVPVSPYADELISPEIRDVPIRVAAAAVGWLVPVVAADVAFEKVVGPGVWAGYPFRRNTQVEGLAVDEKDVVVVASMFECG